MPHRDPEEIARYPTDTQPVIATHDPCAYFLEAYIEGSMEDWVGMIEMATSDERYETIPRQIVAAAIAALPWADSEEVRVPSQRVYEDGLKCTSCVPADLCPIKTELETTIETEKVRRQMDMVKAGPGWLTAARLHGIGMTLREFEAIAESDEALLAAIQTGFSPEVLLGDTRNVQMEQLTIRDLPEELASNLTSARRAVAFETHRIDFADTTYAFTVSDLASDNNFTGLLPTEREYGILVTKLIDVMKAMGSGGEPVILEASLQKNVRSFSGGYVAEIRMGGKSRLYTGVYTSVIAVLRVPRQADKPDKPEQPMYRLLILGAHGDSEQEQQRFYDQTGLSRLPRR